VTENWITVDDTQFEVIENWIGATDNEIPSSYLPQDVAVGDVVIWDKEPILILAYTDTIVSVVRSYMARSPDMHAAPHSTETTPHIVIKARR
jgi:hypothetical protein